MGTWDAGPFDNDKAADFAGDLDDLVEDDRPFWIWAALEAALQGEDVNGSDGDVAIAAAAIVASQCPGGDPCDPIYGPETPIPQLPEDLRPLALQAIDRVLGPKSELPELWGTGDQAQEWHANVRRIRSVIGPEPPAVMEKES
ncbi:DUF4259 domain-containing protein [Actinomadura algeriensis]|uniref:DUF4259 domain-containing protein n=1 Tax=Actinomadura algeriensis TaxID=1679523 RepID=A0ABR9JVE8_9ACTN|nr:DUF4259 domain-containing protein [Actinomadura algeriensis]MBE1534378.1 hypothetical protein [Actinomadura algeriensis]